MNSSANIGIDEIAFYGRLLVLSGLHSLDRNRFHRIERWTDRSESFCKASTDSIGAVSQDSEDDHKFRVFLDCLAELCASARNGGTVTAVTVHLPETSRPPQYLFVSNSRSNSETNAAKGHVEGILVAFEPGHNYPDLPRHWEVVPGVRHEVLKAALEFDQERFKEYVKIIYSCRRKLSNRNDLNKSCE
ncbi:hypothetical protein LA080_007751 [Diaporthe eres]|nr:hypothetical protein LA080_007751 [Diaporthe eres]